MNNWMGIGNLVKDVDLKVTTNGKAIASGRIGVKRRFQDKSDFIEVIVWGNQAEKYFAPYGKKGRQVAAQGELNIDTWKDDNGEWQSRTYVTANDIKFLDRKDGQAKEEPQVEGFGPVDDDDIPF